MVHTAQVTQNEAVKISCWHIHLLQSVLPQYQQRSAAVRFITWCPFRRFPLRAIFVDVRQSRAWCLALLWHWILPAAHCVQKRVQRKVLRLWKTSPIWREQVGQHLPGIQTVSFLCRFFNFCGALEFQYLKEYDLVDEERVVKPRKASKQDLLLVHTESYLSSLKVFGKITYFYVFIWNTFSGVGTWPKLLKYLLWCWCLIE